MSTATLNASLVSDVSELIAALFVSPCDATHRDATVSALKALASAELTQSASDTLTQAIADTALREPQYLRNAPGSIKSAIVRTSENAIFDIFGDKDLSMKERAADIRAGRLIGRAVSFVLGAVHGAKSLKDGSVDETALATTFGMSAIKIKKDTMSAEDFILAKMDEMTQSAIDAAETRADKLRLAHKPDGKGGFVRVQDDDATIDTDRDASIAMIRKANTDATAYVTNLLPNIGRHMAIIRIGHNGTVKRADGGTFPTHVAFVRVLCAQNETAVRFADSIVRK